MSLPPHLAPAPPTEAQLNNNHRGSLTALRDNRPDNRLTDSRVTDGRLTDGRVTDGSLAGSLAGSMTALGPNGRLTGSDGIL